ncbi:MAG: hypothetical protein LLG04_00205, partial [Parachlamydia sp.]|nr:hypothetical protein [Parachlamydia sp.]
MFECFIPEPVEYTPPIVHEQAAVPAGKSLSEKSRSVEIFWTTDAGNPEGVVETGRQKMITEMGFSRENFSAGTADEQVVQAVTREDWEIPVSTIAFTHLDTMNAEALDKDWKLPEFFGTIAVIHLPQAKQRLKRITKQLHRIGTDIFDIFPAVDGRKEIPPAIWQKMTGNRDRLNDKT